MKRTRMHLLSGLLALALSCTSSEATDAPASSVSGDSRAGIDPCRLVTKEEAAQALGQEVDGPKLQPGGLPAQKTCAYGSRTSARVLTVSVISAANAAKLYKQFEAASKGGATYQALPALGDAAYRDAGLLYVLRGDVLVGIFVGGLGGSAGEVGAIQQTLATLALSRL